MWRWPARLRTGGPPAQAVRTARLREPRPRIDRGHALAPRRLPRASGRELLPGTARPWLGPAPDAPTPDTRQSAWGRCSRFGDHRANGPSEDRPVLPLLGEGGLATVGDGVDAAFAP